MQCYFIRRLSTNENVCITINRRFQNTNCYRLLLRNCLPALAVVPFLFLHKGACLLRDYILRAMVVREPKLFLISHYIISNIKGCMFI